ncbi:sensor histidine kinase [Maritimibacter sp. 55A14]|uniref:sensor histidine kinase n=1 Tax=Maritimibacter sp. 55A14 TaxID=2174844 RepID=UPI000D61C29F|nr:HAMP domain-containing sensor histidine kinase [Maritimibacter sp. 55A14]PWE31424.1 sensor histidine kinase [Maritimibacter sp. 55A14]
MTDQASSGNPLIRWKAIEALKHGLRASGILSRRDTMSVAAEAQRLERQLKDFVQGSRSLFWTRQGMYIGAGLLTAFYYDPFLAIFCVALCQLTEFLDNLVSAHVISWHGGSYRQARKFQSHLTMTSTLSAIAVALFAILVSHLEGPGSHFTPLFFLFAAGLFAAMNNHQLPKVLLARLVVYGFVFLYIPVRDLLVVRPPLDSELWLQFATVLFVLSFIVYCSMIFLKLYREGLDNLDEIRLERDRARAAYEVKSQFVSVVSHELRTPLHSILGSLSMLSNGTFDNAPDRAAKVMTIAYKNSKRLSNLINDLLDLQKIESGQMEYDFSPTRLDAVLVEAVESLGGFAAQSGIKLKVRELGDDLVALIDQDRIQQVLTNLLSNAVKFSKPDGKVEVSMARGAGKAHIRVRDYGIGIPDGFREKVFEKFAQIDSSDDRSYEGSGLGLSIAEQIVAAHGGTLDYESELGKGTTFTLSLPLC